jgi:hypothetical protein
MEVVELPDGGDAAGAHLEERLGGHVQEILGAQLLHQRVHRVAPAPERSRPGGVPLGMATEPALEAVRMRVHEPGKQRLTLEYSRRFAIEAAHPHDPAVVTHDDADA